MILIRINFAIMFLDILLFALTVVHAAQEFKARYPDIKPKKANHLVTVKSVIKLLVMTFCPIINMIIAWTLIFNDDEMVENIIQKQYLYNRETSENL